MPWIPLQGRLGRMPEHSALLPVHISSAHPKKQQKEVGALATHSSVTPFPAQAQPLCITLQRNRAGGMNRG